jgi:ribosomal-protein-alanine N-acetyltransferase
VFWKKSKFSIETKRCQLRLPSLSDFEKWVLVRRKSEEFLEPWEPQRGKNFYSLNSFKERIKWSERKFRENTALPVFIFKREDDSLLGAITLDNIKKGPSQSASVGYWIGQPFAKKGYMSEALNSIVFYSFGEWDLSRIEAATLPENKASRGLLEKVGFKYEGVAQSYLQISGRWRNHVLYSLLRKDRRGKKII